MVGDKEIERGIVKDLYERTEGEPAATMQALPAGGSDRRYWRIAGKNGDFPAIGAYGPDLAENKSFVSLARYFGSRGIRVPKIYAESTDGHAYIQQDLGSVSLYNLLQEEGVEALIHRCMDSLAELQTLPEEEWIDLPFNKPFSRRQAMWDLNYFKYEYLKPSGVVFDEDALEDCFELLADRLNEVPRTRRGFMFRDCQSRNVMVYRGDPLWIDFQGGRPGPCVYDAVSFLWQAKAGFCAELREKMLRRYAEKFASLRGIKAEDVLADVPMFVTFRTLQVLGAYGFRGLVEKRAHFIESIPGALRNLGDIIDNGWLRDMPELERVCRLLITDERFNSPKKEGLNVTVFSFSYKKGYPTDYSGNGGGFMFDCRAMHNPGRYEEYKQLTGLDKPVRDFLEERGEVQPFLANAWGLADPAVERYLSRGFTSLQIGFGCTGGQHRSVYTAEATARHIAAKFPDAKVTVIHREQGITKQL